MRKLTLAAAIGAMLLFAPVALAASSPTVSPGSVTTISGTAATLHGTVNPNGLTTTYQFHYGATNALGSNAPAAPASAGAGSAAVPESVKLSGLSPATTYYFQLVASNSHGTSSTPIETFKTTGNPAPAVTTGAATGVGRYGATMTGSINPNNQATTYYFQYGPTDAYGFQTAAKSLATGVAAVAVSAALPGLQPGATFHYRLVALHGSTSVSYGAEVVFTTLPWPRPHTGLSWNISPSSAGRAPATFKVNGHLRLSGSISPSLACHGRVTISYYDGSQRVGMSRAPLSSSCTYGARTRIGRLTQRHVRLTVKLRYGGDTYAAPSNGQASVRIG